MATYILRDLPPDLWERVKARSQRDGWPLRPLFLQLLDDYASGRTTPSAAPPTAPALPRQSDIEAAVLALFTRGESVWFHETAFIARALDLSIQATEEVLEKMRRDGRVRLEKPHVWTLNE